MLLPQWNQRYDATRSCIIINTIVHPVSYTLSWGFVIAIVRPVSYTLSWGFVIAIVHHVSYTLSWGFVIDGFQSKEQC